MSDLLQDIRYGLRTLRNQPGFTAVAVLSLALGIGANTAIFSLVDTLLVRQLPVDHPEQLVLLRNIDKDGMTDGYSLLECDRFREQKQVIQDVVALQDPDRDTVKIEGHGETAIRQRVSANFFTALGVKAAAGRMWAQGDAQAVVISYRYWTRRFGRSPSALGSPITLDGKAATLVGVAPPEFFGVQPRTAVDLWDACAPDTKDANDLDLLARLQPGISPKQARDAALAVNRAILNDRARVTWAETLKACRTKTGRRPQRTRPKS